MSATETFDVTAEQHGQHAARRLLEDALCNEQPLRREVRRGLERLLHSLSLGEDPTWGSPESDDRDQAAAWRGAMKQYRALLAEVREHGATAGEVTP